MPDVSVRLPDDVEKELKETSESLNISEEELIDRAIITYLDALEKETSLRKEFKSWDRLSDEALVSTEASMD